jgi:hypothetical protein
MFIANFAAADTVTDFGELVELSMTGEGSDDYGRYRGIALLRLSGVDTEFHWGGSICPGRNLSEQQVAMLQNTGMAPYMRVKISHKPGQGGAQCIVGFALRNIKFVTQ